MFDVGRYSGTVTLRENRKRVQTGLVAVSLQSLTGTSHLLSDELMQYQVHLGGIDVAK